VQNLFEGLPGLLRLCSALVHLGRADVRGRYCLLRPMLHQLDELRDLLCLASAALRDMLSLAQECTMSYKVDFDTVSTVGLESSPVAPALAGLRANEARYFKNKYNIDFTVEPASAAQKTIDYVDRILKEERNIVIASRPLEVTEMRVDNIRWTYVFYENGLSINVLYTLDDAGKRAVGFKLSDGMEVPEELAKFKFARQKSRLAGTIRGSYFVIKNEY
jgi:hypothetical protein